MNRQPGFIGPSYTLRSVNVDMQRSVNLYPEIHELGGGKNGEVASLVGTPGLLLKQTLGSGPIRGTHSVNNRLFVVSGNKLYESVSYLVALELGTISTSTGIVSMADNGLELCIVDGSHGYILTLATNAFQEIVQDGFEGGTRLAFMDGYFITNRPGTRQFYFSNLYDGLTWDALDVASKEGSPDNLVSVLADHRELWLFGERTSEVWFNSGDPDLPFSRISGAFMEHGIAAAHSAQKIDNSVYWLAQDANGNAMVMRANGYQPARASTFAVEQALRKATNFSGATAWTYQEGGHSFYCLNVPGLDSTWCLDIATGLWHERTSVKDGVESRNRVGSHVFFGGLHIVGDYENGNLYELSETTYTDNLEPIIRLRTTPHTNATGERVFFSKAQIDMETGAGIDGAGQGSDPQVMLQWSDDGGHTWGNEHWRSAGKIGEYKRRVIWNRLGSARDRVWKLKISDPVKVVLISAFGDGSAGAH
jgi:hypothetical protein